MLTSATSTAGRSAVSASACRTWMSTRFATAFARVARCPLPGRADPERTDAHRPVEVAPAVLPARFDVGRARAAEGVPEAFLAGGVGVRNELGRTASLDLLESAREQLEHHGAGLLQPLVGDLDADSAQGAQRKALFSFSKKPSSGLYVSASLACSNRSSRPRCSSVRRCGTVTLTSTR